MITLTEEQAQQIEEALAEVRAQCSTTNTYKALATIRAARAQEQAEHVSMKECRHCGFLCKPNANESKKWYPLEQAEQRSDSEQKEPVAWHHPKCDGQCIACLIEKAVQDAYGTQGRDYMLRHINAAAYVRTKDLTADEVEALFWKWKSATEYPVPLFEFRDIARAVIAKDREKNK